AAPTTIGTMASGVACNYLSTSAPLLDVVVSIVHGISTSDLTTAESSILPRRPLVVRPIMTRPSRGRRSPRVPCWQRHIAQVPPGAPRQVDRTRVHATKITSSVGFRRYSRWTQE